MLNFTGFDSVSRLDWESGSFHPITMTARRVLSEAEGAALIEAIALAGDRTAFCKLFEVYAPRIKAQARRFGFNDEAAEDVAQDAMLSVWRRASQFDVTRGTASAWIFSIATNARIDRMRRDKHLAHAQQIDPESPALVAGANEPSGLMSRKLDAVVGALPEEQRKIVHLSFFADLPHSEIAQRLGLPLGTVKSRIRLAIAKLRLALGNEA